MTQHPSAAEGAQGSSQRPAPKAAGETLQPRKPPPTESCSPAPKPPCKKLGTAAPSTAIAFPEHPWNHSPGPGSQERLSKAAPCPSAHCTPRTTTLPSSCRSAGAPTLPYSPPTRWEQQSSSFLSSPAYHPILTPLQSKGPLCAVCPDPYRQSCSTAERTQEGAQGKGTLCAF